MNTISLAEKHTVLLSSIVIGLFCCILATPLFSDGMFLDGITYAAVAHNMSLGIGSFWEPHLSDHLFNTFHEHPTLAIGIQALFFKVFGGSIYVERFYSFGSFLINAWLIVAIWKELTNNKSLSFLPLLFFILIPDIQWSFSNNLLENTMMIFCSLSFYALVKHLKTEKLGFLFIGALFLFFSILSKGFVGLYLWGFPIFSWFFLRETSFAHSIRNTLILIFGTILPFLLFYFLYPIAWESFSAYIQKQVIGSIQNVQTVGSRFEIIFLFFSQVIIPVIVSIAFWFFARKKRINESTKKERKYGFLLLCLVAGGVLPILISLKQRGFYVLTVYPFFALALALFIKPYADVQLQRLSVRSIKGMRIFALFLFAIGLSLTIYGVNKPSRDAAELDLIYFIEDHIESSSTLDLNPDLRRNWSLHSYAARHGQFSLNTKAPFQSEFKIEKSINRNQFKEDQIVYSSDKYLVVKK